MPGGELADRRGERWSVEGDLDLLGLRCDDGVLFSATYPDALGRVWSALRCRTSAEVLLSAKPGYEFVDWGGEHHVGGGSHGSLHANDSLGTLLWCGTGPGQRGRAAAVDAARHRADGARSTSACRRESRARRAAPARRARPERGGRRPRPRRPTTTARRPAGGSRRRDVAATSSARGRRCAARAPATS